MFDYKKVNLFFQRIMYLKHRIHRKIGFYKCNILKKESRKIKILSFKLSK